MAGTKKINKAKARPKESSAVANVYEIIQDMVVFPLFRPANSHLTNSQDGNPASPQEFDVSPHDEGEVYFKADDDASKVCS